MTRRQVNYVASLLLIVLVSGLTAGLLQPKLGMPLAVFGSAVLAPIIGVSTNLLLNRRDARRDARRAREDDRS
jgi:hypothetical protein